MKKWLSWLLVLVLCAGMVTGLTACNNTGGENKGNGESSGEGDSDQPSRSGGNGISGSKDPSAALVEPGTKGEEMSDDIGKQIVAPSEGEEIAVVETSMGTFKIRLFPEEAATAVENFRKNVENGYYNNVEIESVYKDNWMQMDVAQDNKQVDVNYEKNKLYHLYGAVSMAGDGIVSSSTRVTFIQASSLSEDNQKMLDSNDFGYNSEAIAQYKETGGMPFMDKEQTVFGQIFEGLEVLDEIAGLEVDENLRPQKMVRVISVTLEKYA